jgi:6-phospho-beta-glucosidase
MPEERIVIVGGGSPYVPGILYSLAQRAEELAGTEVRLMDVDPARLPLMEKLAERMFEGTGGSINVTSTTALEDALEGTTFVVTNFRPGGIEGLRLDEEIPNKYDVLGQETTGPGGTFFALRSIPPALELCSKVEQVCPEAWVVNYVNPVNFIADALHRRTRVKAISICDGGGNGLRYFLPDLLGVGQDRLVVRAAGVNHHSWLRELRVDGSDGFPLLRKAIGGVPTEAGQGRTSPFAEYGQFLKYFLEKLDLVPANPSYLYPYFDLPEALRRYRAGGRSLYRTFSEDIPEHWRRFEHMAAGKIPVAMDPEKHHTQVGHGDLAVQILMAVAANQTQEFHVNVPNHGCITNLPPDAIVEVPVLVDKNGVRPLCMGDLPAAVVGLTAALINWQELSVDAALSGDRSRVIQALLAHPWIRTISYASAQALCDEMLSAHAAHLPQFR